MASTVQQLFQRPARRPTKTRRHRSDPFRFEPLESRSMLAVVLPAAGDQAGIPLSLSTDGSGPNSLSITLDDSSGTLLATITANTATGTVTETYSNFARSITFSGSFDTDGSEVNAVTLSAPFGVALASDVADFYSWISACDFTGGDVTVTTINADSLVVNNPAGGAAGLAPSSIDGTFTSPTSAPSPTTPGAAITFATNSTVKLGDTRPVQTYDLTITGVNNGTFSAIDLQDAVTVTNALKFVDANKVTISEDITSTGGSVEIESTQNGVEVAASVATVNGDVTITAASSIDLSAATGLSVGPTAGTLTLESNEGTVLFNSTTPLPLVAGGNLAITSALDLAVDVDLTSTNGNVTLESTKGAMTLTESVTATAGSIAIKSDRTLDLSGATSLTTGAIAGSLSLVSTQGKVLLNATSPALNLVAVGDVTVRSGLELKVEVDVTSTTGTVRLESTGDSLRVYKPVEATLGTVDLKAGPAGTVQVDGTVVAGTGITSTSGGGFDLNNSLTTTNGPIEVTVTGVGGNIDLGGATAVTANGSLGEISLESEKGEVVLKSGMPLTADEDITILSDLDFELTADVTSRFGDVVLKSTGGDLDIAGTVSVLAGNLILEAEGAIDDGSGGSVGILLVTGTTTVTAGAGQTITLDNATGPGHDFTGAVTVTKGGTVALADRNAIVLGSIDISGGLSVNAVGISQTGAITQTSGVAPVFFDAGAGPIALTEANDFRGAVTLTNSGAFNVAVRDKNQIDLALVDVGTGTLAVTAVGIVQSGAITQAAGAGQATFTGGASAIVLTDVANELTGPVALVSNTDATLVNTMAVALGTSTVGGKLDVTATGPITQAGPVAVTGTTTLTAGAANAITLTNAANDFGGAVSVVSGDNVALTDANAIVLGVSTVSGNLVVAASGAITQNGALAVTGTTRLAAGAANGITLTDAGNVFTGAVTVLSGRNVALTDSTAVDIAGATVSGAFAVTAGGDITQSAPLAVTGTTSLTAGPTHDITLADADNDFIGDVTVVSGRDVTLEDANAIQFGGASVVGRDLDVTAAGAVTDGASGTMAVTGLTVIRATGAFSDIALDNTGNAFNGDVTLEAGRDARLGGTGTIQFGGTSTVGRNLLVTAAGSINDGAAGKLDVTGRTTLVATGSTSDIVLDNPGHDLGSDVTLSSGRNTTLVYEQALEFAGASVIGGNLFLNVDGAITDGLLGTVAVSGASFLTMENGPHDVTLDNANDFGDIAISDADDVTLNDVDGIAFIGASDVAGDLVVTAGGSITAGIGGSLGVAGTTSLSATTGTSDIDLPGANTFAGGISMLSAGDATLGTAGGLTFVGASVVGGDLAVSAGGSITDDTAATLTVSGKASFTTTGLTSGITLDNSGHTLAGDVTVTTSSDVVLKTLGDLQFGGASTIGGDLTVTASGSITDGSSGTLSVIGTTALEAVGGAGDILLDNGHDFGGDVTVESVGGTTLTANGPLQFGGASDVGGALTVTAGGSISDGTAGTVAVTGPTTLTANGPASDIDLTNTGHLFGGVITFTSGQDTTLTDGNAITVGTGSVVGRNLALTAAGAITQTGGLTVAGSTSLAAGSKNDITLDDIGNDFTGPVSVVSGSNVKLVDKTALVLGLSTVSGNLSAKADGPITQAGGLTVAGGTSLTAGATNDITLDDVGNDFTGAVSVVSGLNVTLVDATALVLGGSTVSGNLVATAGDAITQTGRLAVAGTTDLTADAADVTLTNPANDFVGAVSVLSAVDVGLRDATALVLGPVAATGNLDVKAGGAITQTAALVIGGTSNLTATGATSDITLDAANDFGGDVTVASGRDTTLNGTGSVSFAGTSTIGRTLLVTAADDIAIVANAKVSVNGNAGFTAAGDFILVGTLETTGVAAPGDVTITTTGVGSVIDLSAATSKLIVAGTLTLNGSGGVKLNPAFPLSTGGGFTLVANTTKLEINAAIKALAGPITITNPAGDLAITADIETNGATGVINLTAGREINGGGDNDPVTSSVVSNKLIAIAGANAGTFSPQFGFTSVDNDIDELSVTLTNGSGVEITNIGSIQLSTLKNDRGTVVLESLAGGITVDATVASIGASSTLTGITLQADDAIVVKSAGGLIVNGAGDITIKSGTNAIAITGPVRANAVDGDVSLTSGGSTGIALSGLVYAGNDVTLDSQSNIAIGQAGALTSVTANAGRAKIDSVAGPVTVYAAVSAPLGRVDVKSGGTLSYLGGSITASSAYDTPTGVDGLAPSTEPGVVVLNGGTVSLGSTAPTISAGRFELTNGGGSALNFSGVNSVGSLYASSAGSLTFQNVGSLAITDFDPQRVTTQVAVGGLTITNAAGSFRVVDRLSYGGPLALSAPGSALGVQFVTTAVNDIAAATVGGALIDMIGHINANTATATGLPNAVMSAVFDETDSPVAIAGTITVLSALPAIAKQVTFDGTLPIANAGGVVGIDGQALVAANTSGLRFARTATGSIVRNAAVHGFTGTGLTIRAASTSVSNMYVGLERDGLTAAGNGLGIDVTGASATRNAISSSYVANNKGIGIAVRNGANSTSVVANVVGLSVDGTAAGNAGDGIAVDKAIGVIVGGTTSAERNVVASNLGSGISLSDVAATSIATGSQVFGNVIRDNAVAGVTVRGGGFNQIGSGRAGSGNVISRTVGGVQTDGVQLLSSAAGGGATFSNQVVGNTITGHSRHGVSLVEGYASTVRGNVLEDNAISGVRVSGATATTKQPGHRIVRNVISGSGTAATDGGIVLEASSGQFVGISATGANAGNTLANNPGSGIVVLGGGGGAIARDNAIVANEVSESGFDGIRVQGAIATSVRSNAVSGNVKSGIQVMDSRPAKATGGNVITGNSVSGNQEAGVRVTGSTWTSVGGTLPALGNSVYSNNSDGVLVEPSTVAGAAANTRIQNNTIGVTPAGVASGNSGFGIRLEGAQATVVDFGNVVRNNVQGGVRVAGGQTNMVGSGTAGRGNVISDNLGDGIVVTQPASGQTVSTTIAGNTIEANTGNGISVSGTRVAGVVIGRAPSITQPNATANTIRGNTGDGIRVDGTQAVTIIGNVFAINDGEPINLVNGANGGVVPPVLTSATVRGGAQRTPQYDVRGTMTGSRGQRFYIDLYGTRPGDSRQFYLGRVLVTIGAGGTGSFRTIINGGAGGVTEIVATATLANTMFAGTSEFSAAIATT